MSKEIISKLDVLDNGLKKLSAERKVVLPHHKTFELVDPRSFDLEVQKSAIFSKNLSSLII